MAKLPLQLTLLWHSYLFVWICGLLAAVWNIPATFSAAIVVLADRRLWKIQRMALCVLLFGSAFLYVHWHITNARNTLATPPSWLVHARSNDRVCGHIDSVNSLPGNRLRIILSQVTPADSQGNHFLPGKCQWTLQDPPLGFVILPGQTACINRKPGPIHGLANTEANEFEARLFAKNILWRIWSKGDAGKPQLTGNPDYFARLRHTARENFITALKYGEIDNSRSGLSPAHAILLALIFGDRQYITQEQMNRFAASTLAHSLALSGQHLVIAGLFGYWVIVCIGLSYPAIYLFKSRIILASMASIPLALAYLWLGNAPPSLLRAASMLAILALWIWKGHIFTGLDLLCAALGLILVINPLGIFDTGLQLSALCVAIIVLTVPAIKNFLNPGPLKKFNPARNVAIFLKNIFLVSLVIQVSILPITLSRFHMAGFWFPLNIFWLPVLGFFVLPMAATGLVLASLPWELTRQLAGEILNLASCPCQYLLHILEKLETAQILRESAFLYPHWSVLPCFAIIIPTLTWLFVNRLQPRTKNAAKYFLAFAMILLAIGPFLRLVHYFTDKVTVEALDVGQAQAIYLKLPGQISILVDGGGNFSSAYDLGKNVLAPIVADNTPPALSAIINTHPDMDHLGGFFYLLEHFDIGNIFHNGKSASHAIRDKWGAYQKLPVSRIPVQGERIAINGADSGLYLEVLFSPEPDNRSLTGNAASLVLRLCQNGQGLALFTGDAEKETLNRLLHSGQPLQAKVLFAPHHGSDRSFSGAFYDAVNPELVIVSCGFQNRWNYPGKKISNWFRKRNIPVYDTGNHGRITIKFNANNTYDINFKQQARKTESSFFYSNN